MKAVAETIKKFFLNSIGLGVIIIPIWLIALPEIPVQKIVLIQAYLGGLSVLGDWLNEERSTQDEQLPPTPTPEEFIRDIKARFQAHKDKSIKN